MRSAIFLAVAIGGWFTAAAPAPGAAAEPHVLHEKRDGAPIAWKKYGRAAGHERIPVRIALKQRNLEHADRFLDQISHPDSPNYGQCLSWLFDVA